MSLVNTTKTLKLFTLNLDRKLLDFPNYELVTIWASLIKGDNDPWVIFIVYEHNPWTSLIMSWDSLNLDKTLELPSLRDCDL